MIWWHISVLIVDMSICMAMSSVSVISKHRFLFCRYRAASCFQFYSFTISDASVSVSLSLSLPIYLFNFIFIGMIDHNFHVTRAQIRNLYRIFQCWWIGCENCLMNNSFAVNKMWDVSFTFSLLHFVFAPIHFAKSKNLSYDCCLWFLVLFMCFQFLIRNVYSECLLVLYIYMYISFFILLNYNKIRAL